MGDDLTYWSATRLVAAYREKSVSPVEVSDAVLARIEAADPGLNAFCLLDHDGARAAARASEGRWAKGEPCGALDGVPVTIKDIILTRGWATLRGSRTIDPDQDWPEDAPVTARLREAGAVLIGKTTTPEFGWKGLSDNPLTGITRNPWNTDKTPGGSSGGAAAACAAGMGALHVGTDGGGSIRIPAAMTGIFGLKPSFGRVPAYPASPFGTIAHVGPMTRTVADAALMLNVISQPDARDWLALPPEGRDYTKGLDGGVKGLRIAYSPALGYAHVEPRVARIVAAAVQKLADLGAHVDEVDPGFADPTEAFNTIWKAGALNGLKGLSDDQRAMMDPGLQAVYAAGEALSLVDFLDANTQRATLAVHMNRFHRKFDLLATPALAVTAFDVGRLAPDEFPGIPPGEPNKWVYWTPFTYPFNLTRQPACSIPCGFDEDGLPVGLQLVGAMFADALVLRAAAACEQVFAIDRRPALSAQTES